MVMQIKLLVVVVVVSEGRGRVCTQASVSGARSTYSCGMYQISETRSSRHSPTQPAWQAFKRTGKGSFKLERNARDAGYLLPKHQLSVLPRIPAVPIGTSVL